MATWLPFTSQIGKASVLIYGREIRQEKKDTFRNIKQPRVLINNS